MHERGKAEGTDWIIITLQACAFQDRFGYSLMCSLSSTERFFNLWMSTACDTVVGNERGKRPAEFWKNKRSKPRSCCSVKFSQGCCLNVSQNSIWSCRAYWQSSREELLPKACCPSAHHYGCYSSTNSAIGHFCTTHQDDFKCRVRATQRTKIMALPLIECARNQCCNLRLHSECSGMHLSSETFIRALQGIIQPAL